MSETTETRKLCRELEQLNCYVIAVVGGKMQQPGLPDRIIVHSSGVYFLEFKLAKGKVSPIQAAVIKAINERGWRAFVIRFGNPNRLEDYGGGLIWEFTTAKELLNALRNQHGLQRATSGNRS